jgi:hypothetical protein
MVRARWPLAAPGVVWKASLFVFLIAFVIIARACGYDLGAVFGYAAYFAAYVALPGIVVLALLNRGPLSLMTALALAVPTGFALEIFTYLGLAALDLRGAYRFMPLLWLALGWWWHARHQAWPVRWRVSGSHAGLALGLAVAFLGTVFMAASQMFAESPLSTGLPSRAIFHDWVYLVSRAAVIKNNWPLDDPSLSGTPLQYHYFLMVHAAAASATTGVELTLIMLRLVMVPLGAVLVAQAYLLGRRVARSPWGGVIAALLLVIASEVSFASSYNRTMFLGLFVRWLFVSPTFFFGMIYCGALLLAVDHCTRVGRCTVWHIAWLALMAAAGTGAKGTLLPVMLCALALWFVWRWARERRFPLRLAVFGVVMGLAFGAVYFVTMSSWRTGDAAFRPFHVFELTEFWKTNLPLWKQSLALWLPDAVASPLATLACAAVVFAGTCGVRLLAIPYLFWGQRRVREPLVGWLGAFFIASAGMGMLMELNSYGELYLILMIRLPMAVLAAAFIVDGARRLHRWTGERAPWVSLAPEAVAVPNRTQRAVLWSGVAVCALALTVQASLWLSRNRPGFSHWLATPPRSQADDSMRQLHEALLWVRKNTDRDAVLVTNVFTLENMKKDHWGALDRTLAGVHFYYSALSERRLWFEGHNYIMDTTRARLRANMASAFFYRGRPLDPAVISPDAPSYAVLDRSLADGARVDSPAFARVFQNARIEIYELSRGNGATPALAAALLPSDRE